ncbi:type IV secretion system protein [Paeniroseomonas aquatica]|uniref:Type IV secretion system protein n=1 Tax=Paeniroseomonas aquatica TaxID=373043 RepID=A0ABT7ZZU4_9PROT|nr:type IV secretion system protein [Paeniroseomonas aquatica]MDN3562997.1 type IV secretion system protein [Paeniroseomonas aquatica]
MTRNPVAALAAALTLSTAQMPAQAQGIPVYDNASNLTRIVEAGKALQQAIQQYRMLESTYNTLAHATDVGSVAIALGGATRTFMPESRELAGLLSGAGSLYGAASGLLTSGRYADVGRIGAFAQEMQRRELATANFRAIGQAGLESAQGSILGLTSLLDRITGSRDVTEVSAVNGALAVEQQNIEHHKAQIAQVQLMLATEDRVERQRAEQQRWESANTLYENTSPVTDTLR